MRTSTATSPMASGQPRAGPPIETPEFAWSNGQGHFDPVTGDGYVQFTGSVRFTGHDGLLDTTITDPGLSITRDGGFLILDVSGPSMEGEQIDASRVSFVELNGVDVSGDGARVTVLSDTVLTADGEAAFPDYQAGTAFDPVTMTLPLAGCSADYAGGGDLVPSSAPPLPAVGLAVLGPLFVAAAIVALIVVVLRRRARA